MESKKGAIAFIRADGPDSAVVPYLLSGDAWAPLQGHEIFNTIEVPDQYVPKNGASWMKEFTTLVNLGYTARGVFDSLEEIGGDPEVVRAGNDTGLVTANSLIPPCNT